MAAGRKIFITTIKSVPEYLKHVILVMLFVLVAVYVAWNVLLETIMYTEVILCSRYRVPTKNKDIIIVIEVIVIEARIKT